MEDLGQVEKQELMPTFVNENFRTYQTVNQNTSSIHNHTAIYYLTQAAYNYLDNKIKTTNITKN